MEGIGQEIRHAARRLLRSPAFTLAAVLTLALAIGANVSIFAVVQRVVLNPLPYPESDRLIEFDHGALGLNVTSGLSLTSGIYFHYLERAQTLESAALFQTSDQTLTGGGEPERIKTAVATPSLAAVLRVPAALGRWFTDEEGKPGAPRVAVLSHGLWTRRYGRDPRAIGQTITLNGKSTEVIGVMPATFAFPDPLVELWVAEQLTRASGFGLWDYRGVGRLRDGVTLDQARTELNQLLADLPKAYPDDPRALGNVQTRLMFVGRSQKEAVVGAIERPLWILLASVGLVLLIACANVANLFLVRTEARQREVAVRRALGAGRSGIARYFLTESLLLSIVGSLVGLGLAWGAVRLLVAFSPPNLPRLDEIRLDGTALLFTLALGAVTALAFGAIPLWRGAALATALHESGRSNTASRGRHRMRQVLMGAQIALALVLLVASGLMVRSFQQLRAADPGFNPSAVLTFSVGLPDYAYPTTGAAVAAHDALIERLATLPGIAAVSASTCLPLGRACNGNTLRVEGRSYPAGTVPPLALFRAVAGDYFATTGMRLLRGRGIDRGDVDRKEPIVVINDALAKRYFANEDPIGKRVASNVPPSRPGAPPDYRWLMVVGVVGNTPINTVGEPNPMPQIYLPMSLGRGADTPFGVLAHPPISAMRYVVRSSVSPLDVLPSVRRAILSFDENLPLAQVSTLEEAVDRASAQMAFTMFLLAIAAAVALALGIIGIYGVMSYIVSQRTSEIGVRMALGAEPGNVAAQIVKQGGLVALVGIVVGLVAAFAGSRLIETLLYGVSPRDPSVFVATTVTLLVVALLACWLPARRAARLSPVDALRAN